MLLSASFHNESQLPSSCRYITTQKVEVPDIVMSIHPHLEGEFWGPTVDMLLDENIVTCFTAFNEEHFKQALERLDYVFAKYIFKVLLKVSG